MPVELFDINHSYILFDQIPRAMEIKTEINKWDLIKLKSFCTGKKAINEMKRQPLEWQVISNETTDKRLISKIYSSCSSIPEKQTTQSKSGTKT